VVVGGYAGGDPDSIGAGGAQLLRAAGSIGSRATGVDRVGARGGPACGSSPVAAALARFVAAYSQFVTDVGIETTALATLAGNAATDLHVTDAGRMTPRAD
jgi:hypothetical protein